MKVKEFEVYFTRNHHIKYCYGNRCNFVKVLSSVELAWFDINISLVQKFVFIKKIKKKNIPAIEEYGFA